MAKKTALRGTAGKPTEAAATSRRGAARAAPVPEAVSPPVAETLPAGVVRAGDGSLWVKGDDGQMYPHRVESGVAVVAFATAAGADAAARAERVEKAMADAVTRAMADGVSLDNADEIRKRMVAARDEAMKAE